MTGDAAALDSHIDAHLDERIAELSDLCRIASVSSRRQDLEPCAKLVAGMLERRGFAVKTIDTDTAPVVFAEIGEGPRTILFYNHYDVQPAEPLDLWTAPPFEPSQRDGALYARGAIDDKGEFASRLAAIDAFRAANPKLPIRLKLIVEGAEEIGSPGLERFVRDHASMLHADACIWEAGGIDAGGRPQIALGLRGMLYVELIAKTMSRDAHSGDAHALPNAAWRLLRALSSLKDEHERILIDGFYGSVRPPSATTTALLERIPSPGPGWRKDLGIRTFAGARHDDELAAAVFSPTCNIAGFTSGYGGPGAKTVIPSQAACKIDFRLVPDQEPNAVADLLRTHLIERSFDDIEVRVLDGIHPAMSDPDAPIVATAVEAARDAWGEEPLVVPMVGGSGPMAFFTRDLRLPVISVGCSYPGGRKHAPDEHVRIEHFARGAKHVARILAAF
jgi:acetylornithine deacetylase/succinyl-diaminopimelate desuccinylase-like protein